MRKQMLNPINVAILLFCLFAVSTVMAQESLKFNYQGYLTDSDGNPITGSDIQMTFKIYDASGLLLWTSGPLSVPVNNGLFTQLVDWADWSTDTEDNPYNNFYLGITIGEDPEISPRTLLTSAPSAGVSKRVAGDIHTGPQKLHVPSTTGDSAIVLMAEGDMHAIQLHPPEPCVPPDPCEPALEMVAEPDKNIIRVHPPDPCVPPEPCDPAFELIAESETHSMKLYSPNTVVPGGTRGYLQALSNTSSIELSIHPQAEGAGDICSGVALGWETDSSKSYLRLGTTSAEDSGPSVEVYTVATPDRQSGGIVIENPAPDGSDPFGASISVDELGNILIGAPMDNDPDANSWLEMASNAGASFAEVHSRKPTGGQTAVAMTADDALAQLIMINGDPTEPSDVVILATTDGGGQIGINTDSPEEALDVNGTTKTSGFKMPTDAADGRVLTSDAEGNGTWQAATSASSDAGAYDGDVQADYVETDPGASDVVNFASAFTTTGIPHMYVTAVMKQNSAALNLVEGAAVKAQVEIQGTPGNWTGFKVNVSKHSGGSLTDGTKVFVTWMAIGR